MTYTFDSQFSIGNSLPEFTTKEIKDEPMFWQCDADFAYEHGGPITRAFLETIKIYSGMIVDTRTHMLMPGWYPCIPGFHHDDVPRTRIDGQPNYDTPEYHATHVMALINGHICPTEFAIGKAEFSDVPLGKTLYKVWHKEVEEKIIRRDLISVKAPSNKLIWFDWNTWHQGTRSVKSGWRWFGRASFGTNLKPQNEIRKQVQVYLEFPMEGW